MLTAALYHQKLNSFLRVYDPQFLRRFHRYEIEKSFFLSSRQQQDHLGFIFDSRFTPFGHYAFLVNYARWKASRSHKFHLSRADLAASNSYIQPYLPHNVHLSIHDGPNPVKIQSAPDVVQYLDNSLLNLHASSASGMLFPPKTYVHNVINNMYLGSCIHPVLSPLEATYISKIPKPYVVIHFRSAPDDLWNRNLPDESSFQLALEYLGSVGLYVVQIGKSRHSLSGNNLLVLDQYSSPYDLALMHNALCFIGSVSGPSAWIELLSKPSLLIDNPMPVHDLIYHVSELIYMLPKTVQINATQDHQYSLLNNINELCETGILWWSKNTELPGCDNAYNCSDLVPSSPRQIKSAVKLFIDTLSNGYSTSLDKTFNTSPYLSLLGIKSKATILNPFQLV